MHHLIAAFYAFVFSLGHAVSTHTTQAKVEAPPPVPTYFGYAPSRHEIARSEVPSSYAEKACVSCRRMNISYNVR